VYLVFSEPLHSFPAVVCGYRFDPLALQQPDYSRYYLTVVVDHKYALLV